MKPHSYKSGLGEKNIGGVSRGPGARCVPRKQFRYFGNIIRNRATQAQNNQGGIYVWLEYLLFYRMLVLTPMLSKGFHLLVPSLDQTCNSCQC